MIPFQRPRLPSVEATARYYALAEERRHYTNFGACHELLASRLAERIGPPVTAVPVANCTLGLLLALRACTAGQDAQQREVIVPSYTFAATGSAIAWAGLTPVFVDVDTGHWSMSPASLEQALAQRAGSVAAVLACTTFGAPPPLAVSARWEELAAAAGVPLIVDSAAGFGTRDAAGREAGHLGDAEVFSLHATKPVAIGEGGFVATADPELAAAIRRLANFGFEDGQVTGEIGLNAKLAEWPAAAALAALEEIDTTLETRRSLAASLRAVLEPAGFTFQVLDSEPTWQFVPVLAPTAASREAVLRAGAAAGVQIRTYFDRPLHTMPPFRGAPTTGALAVTMALAGRTLSLPMADDLSEREVETITRTATTALYQQAAR